MEGYVKRCPKFKSRSYIDLRVTHDAYMYIWKVEINEILSKIKDPFWCRWHASIVWTLVEGINDKVNRTLSRK